MTKVWLDTTNLAWLAGWAQLDLSQPGQPDILKRLVANVLSELSSSDLGVVLDPEYGLPNLPAHFSQLAITVLDPFKLPALLKNWSVEAVAHNYGLVHLPLQYHPSDENALDNKKLVAELSDFARIEQTSVLLELRYPQVLDHQVLLQAAQELQPLVSQLWLPMPEESMQAITFTAELDTSWLVSSSPSLNDYTEYKTKLRLSLESGAFGAVISWPVLLNQVSFEYDSAGQPDWGSWQRQLQTTLRDRVLEIVRIVAEQTKD